MPVSKPTWLTSLNQDGALAKVLSDERQLFGSRMAYFNDIGFERFHGLIDEYRCNGLSISYEGMAENKVVNHLAPDLTKVSAPEAITELHIGNSGAFSPSFDFTSFQSFTNVRALTLYSVPMSRNIKGLFPNLEVLRVFDWKNNKVAYKPELWPDLRALQIANFRGDPSVFAGWKLRSLFLDKANLTSFAALRSFPKLETLRVDSLGSDADLSVLSDLPGLKHLSLRKPRRPPLTAGFASRSMEVMILEKIDHIDLQGFPNLKIYGIDLGGNHRLDRWDEFRTYGDPFAAVHSLLPVSEGS